MKRRAFCKLLAGTAGVSALPLLGQNDGGSPSPLKPTRSYPVSDWNEIIQGRNFEANGGKVRPETWNGVSLTPPEPGLAGIGPYQANWESMLQYEAPEWYRDAKFGIWAHWSPQCVAEAGDWYARFMYVQDDRRYEYQCAHYGHPTKFGYKDLCAQWTLLNWEPEALMERYSKAGARIFLALANHHDGFDTWNSRFQPWNAKNLGPHRDVVGDWATAARRQGMRFGVSVHSARNWWWMRVARLCDKTGPLAGVPYDGNLSLADGKGQWWEGYDPELLYGRKHLLHEEPDQTYVRNFYDRVRDLIDQHDPDLLYFDDVLLPLGWAGMNIGSYFYNHNLQTRAGKMEAILNVKIVPDHLTKAVVADYERGVTSQIMPHAWQSETCLGEWHYDRKLFRDHGYMKPAQVVHWLIDAVSKNGTFILNVPGLPDGTIDADELAVLNALTGWIAINGESVYSSRPWRVFGESANADERPKVQLGGAPKFQPGDIRFTRNKKGDVVYALILGWPESRFLIRAFGASPTFPDQKVVDVSLLGSSEKIDWRQTQTGLQIPRPAFHPPSDYAAAYKIRVAA